MQRYELLSLAVGLKMYLRATAKLSGAVIETRAKPAIGPDTVAKHCCLLQLGITWKQQRGVTGHCKHDDLAPHAAVSMYAGHIVSARCCMSIVSNSLKA